MELTQASVWKVESAESQSIELLGNPACPLLEPLPPHCQTSCPVAEPGWSPPEGMVPREEKSGVRGPQAFSHPAHLSQGAQDLKPYLILGPPELNPPTTFLLPCFPYQLPHCYEACYVLAGESAGGGEGEAGLGQGFARF